MIKLFHREVHMPEALLNQIVGKEIKFSFSYHARSECRNDRYGFIIPPTSVKIEAAKVVELESTDGKVSKVTYRQALDGNRDIVLVFMPNGFVKTLWVNLSSDKHYTLKREIFSKSL